MKTQGTTFVTVLLLWCFYQSVSCSAVLEEEFPIIPYSKLKQWAGEISEKIHHVERVTVRRDVIQKGFANVKMATRNGTAIVEKMAAAIEDLLETRIQAAENIMREAEKLYGSRSGPENTRHYFYDRSLGLDTSKKVPRKLKSRKDKREECSSPRKVLLKSMPHFGRDVYVTTDISSVQVAQDVFDCDDRILGDIYWSEGLLKTFQSNYERDAMTDFQYFCSAKGFLRHYPASEWSAFFRPNLNDYDEELGDVYDCRLRPWYVAAGGAPRDILILFDGTGSMVNSSNLVNADKFTLALLSALTDDDQVNVLRFHQILESPISCFNDKLVSSNNVNSAAMLSTLKDYWVQNFTKMETILEKAIKILQKEQLRTEKPAACQQAIVLLADSIEKNYTHVLKKHDPHGCIRMFVIWLHDRFGLRDGSREFGQALSCASDGYFAELVTANDVTEQVMQVLRVMERPLVAQRARRLRIFSDLYAHVEDPRRSEFYWHMKENDEQKYRYMELRKHKEYFLSPPVLWKHYMRQENLNVSGQYYEGEGNIRYRLQISVSVPVFDETTSENITITLAEETHRQATRTYPVNRLLGVAGVDIPIDHLKLILPYYKLGAGGSLFIIDHRGSIVLHDNLKPVFEGDILRPGYRTVDILDLEQPAEINTPRSYPKEWRDFRNALLIEKKKGSKKLNAKNIFELGMRFIHEVDREYHWKRVMDHYTAVVALPRYNRRYPVHEGKFTQELAAKTYETFTEFNDYTAHPEWLYCKHVDQRYNDTEYEIRHFLLRRKDEPDFPMQKLKHVLSQIPPTLFEKTYHCNEELMVRLCKEALATHKWASEPETECDGCELGAVTAFFATESGLTRWNEYRVTSAHAEPPSCKEWARGPDEPWFKRAVAAPDILVIHAPVAPIQRFRRAEDSLPARTDREKFLTAARVLPGQADKGYIGVAGFHFYPKHLEDVVKAVSDFSNKEEEFRCDGVNWKCVLIDENAWVVAGHWVEEDERTDEDPVREHLSRLYPHAMTALLDAKVFVLNWVHDYQGVCFPPHDAATSLTIKPMIILTTLWKSVAFIFRVARELATVVALLSTSAVATADTEFEKAKRQNRLLRDYQREKFDRLYDRRVLVNRTGFAACDRSRPLYVLNSDPRKLDLLKNGADACKWPLVGAPVPGTNLILLAIMSRELCANTTLVAKPLKDPFVNEQVPIEDTPDMWLGNTSASRLACWRNLEPLPARASHSTCYPHQYEQEEGYRQCGPWLPNANQPSEDDEDEDVEYYDDQEEHSFTAVITNLFSGQ